MPIAPDRTARDDRRRRLLIEGASDAPQRSRRRRSARSAAAKEWGDDAKDERQPAVTQLIPQRRLMVALVVFLLLAGVIGMAALQHLVEGLTQSGVVDVRWLEVTRRAVDWTVGTGCLVAAAYAAMIYSIRRYRTSDYRGRYRMWRWIVVLLVLGSVDVITGIGRLAVELAAGPTALRLIPLLPVAAVLAVGCLLLREMAASKLGLASLLLAGVMQVVRATIMADLVTVDLAVSTITIDAALRLAAAATMFLGFILYARRLRLEANGRIETGSVPQAGETPAKRRKRSRSKSSGEPQAESDTTDEATIPLDAARKTKRRTPAKEAADADEPAAADSPETSDESGPAPRSKKERRRRRKEKRQRKRAA